MYVRIVHFAYNIIMYKRDTRDVYTHVLHARKPTYIQQNVYARIHKPTPSRESIYVRVRLYVRVLYYFIKCTLGLFFIPRDIIQ